MTLDELNRIDVGSAEQVKALQNFLRSRGYYSGAIDGKWGGGTIEGVKALRTDLQNESQTRLKTAEAQASENSPAAQATRFATKFGPYAVGVGSGLLAARGMSNRFDAKDAAQKETVARLAAAKDVNPVIAEQTLKGEGRRRLMRTGGQFAAPAALLGISEVTRRYIAPQFSDEKTREYVNLGATAEQAAGGTLAVKQLMDLPKRSSPNDPVDEARIRSRAAEARGEPYTISGKQKAAAPANAAPDPARMAELRAKRVADLKAEAKAAGLHVSGTKEDLARRIAEAGQQPQAAPKGRLPRGKSGVLLPLAAGALAYDAASSEAEAAGVDPENARRRGVVAGGAAAGTVYGASKLAPYALDAIGKTALGRIAARAFPPAAAAMTAYDLGSMAVEENARPDTMLEGPESGRMPETPGNPQFMARQQALARQTRGAAPTADGQATTSGDDFSAQLQAFFDAIEEHNAGLGGSYGP